MREGLTVLILNPPPDYESMLGTLPKKIHFKKRPSPNLDFIHFFTESRGGLAAEILMLKQSISPTGSLWISWPTVSVGRNSDLSESFVRDIGRKNGLVDAKTCSLNGRWSAMKLIVAPDEREP